MLVCLLSGDRSRLLVCVDKVLVGLGRVLVGLGGVLVCLLVVAASWCAAAL